MPQNVRLPTLHLSTYLGYLRCIKASRYSTAQLGTFALYLGTWLSIRRAAYDLQVVDCLLYLKPRWVKANLSRYIYTDFCKTFIIALSAHMLERDVLEVHLLAERCVRPDRGGPWLVVSWLTCLLASYLFTGYPTGGYPMRVSYGMLFNRRLFNRRLSNRRSFSGRFIL